MVIIVKRYLAKRHAIVLGCAKSNLQSSNLLFFRDTKNKASALD